MRKFNFVIMLTMLLVMVSCEKKQKDVTLDENTSQTKAALVSPSNSSNAYDYIGERVARHSMVLWATEDDGGIDLKSKGIQLKVNYIGGNPRTHAIVTADIWGALGGALLGGPGGALGSAIWGSGIEWISD